VGENFSAPVIDLTQTDSDFPNPSQPFWSETQWHEWGDSVECRLHELHENQNCFSSQNQVNALFSTCVLREDLEVALTKFISQMLGVQKECLEERHILSAKFSTSEREVKTEIGGIQTAVAKFIETHELDAATHVSLVHDQVLSDFQNMFEKFDSCI